MNRTAFFYRPETVTQYTKGKRVEEVRGISKPRDLLEIVERLDTSTEVIHLEQGQIIPSEHNGRPYLHSQNFLKRGPKVVLSQPRSVEDAVHRELSALTSRRTSYDHLAEGTLYSGMTWSSLRTGEQKVVHLVDVLESGRIVAYAHQSSDKKDKMRAQGYSRTVDLRTHGAVALVDVPSRSNEGVFTVTLHHIPLLNNDAYHRFGLWRELKGSGHGGGFKSHDETATRSCTKTYDPITFAGRRKREVFCAHEMAAYFYVSQRIRETTGHIIRQPFPLPTQLMVDIYLTLENNVLVTERRTSKVTGKPYTVHRGLNEAEVEILLWEMVKKHGHDPVFYSRTRLQERRWTTDSQKVAG